MGGRGSLSSDGQSIDSYVFSTVGFVDGYNDVKDVKIILQNNLDTSTPTPVVCNTPDTTYIAICPVYDDKHEIMGYATDHVYYYKGHYLEKSVDLNEKGGPHYHYWTVEDGIVKRKSHQKSNHYTDLTAKDLYYKEKCDIFVKYLHYIK